MTPEELARIEDRLALVVAANLSAPSDSPWWRAIDSVTDVPALIAALRDAQAEVAQVSAALDEGRAAIGLAGAEVERASVEVDRAHRALLASNAERDDLQRRIDAVRAVVDDPRATGGPMYDGYVTVRDVRRALDGTAPKPDTSCNCDRGACSRCYPRTDGTAP